MNGPYKLLDYNTIARDYANTTVPLARIHAAGSSLPGAELARFAARIVDALNLLKATEQATVARCDSCGSTGALGSECEGCGTERLTVLP